MDFNRLTALSMLEHRGQLNDQQRMALAELRRRAQTANDRAASFVEPALTMATGAIAEPISGFVGLAGLPFGLDASTRAIERTQEALTYKPKSQAGQQAMQGLQQFMAPVGEAFEGASSYLGDKTLEATGSPALATAAYSLPTAALEAVGLRGARAIPGKQFEFGDIQGQAFGQRGIFGGVRAKGADLDAQAKAEQMLSEGASRDEIWQETGWFKDVDDQWKFEIDDSFRVFTPEEANALGEALDAEVMYSYPDERALGFSVRDMESGSSGAFSGTDIALNKNILPSEIESTAFHELQHAIQGREGFAQGGSPMMFAGGSGNEVIDPKFASNLEKHNQKLREYGFPEDEMFQVTDVLENDPELLGSELEKQLGWLADKAENKVNYDLDEPDFSEVQAVESLWQADPYRSRAVGYSADEIYRRLAGEAEARNVQTRLNMTPEERRAKPPWETLDVPEEELIVRK